MSPDTTIVALSSGSLPAGVGVIRMSGPASLSVLESLCGELPRPRKFTLRDLRFENGEIIDRALVVSFPAPKSFTGEDCVEFHVHGSRAVVAALLDVLTGFPGVVLAEAGDFTRRAFEAGKLDLTAVEGLGDLLEAATEGQRKLALARATGALRDAVSEWRSQLISLRAEVEAQLDFSDEGDVPPGLQPDFWGRLEALGFSLEQTLGSLRSGRIVREGFRVVLAGPPNVGKSALLNALTNSELAIVTNEAGTTRDVREASLSIGGQLVLMYDVAGIREADNKVEIEGVRRARLVMRDADLVLWLTSPDIEDVFDAGIEDIRVVRVGAKCDLGHGGDVDLEVSAEDGVGLTELRDFIALEAKKIVGSEPLLVSHRRDLEALRASLEWLEPMGPRTLALEIVAEHLRGASDALGRLTGNIDAEAVLDNLFLGFCIGK